MAFTARPKIHPHSQIFRYGQSIFCLPHQPKFSDFFDSFLYCMSVVRALTSQFLTQNFKLKHLFFFGPCAQVKLSYTRARSWECLGHRPLGLSAAAFNSLSPKLRQVQSFSTSRYYYCNIYKLSVQLGSDEVIHENLSVLGLCIAVVLCTGLRLRVLKCP